MVAGGVGSLSWKLVYWFTEKSWPGSYHGLKNDLCTGLESVGLATILGQTRWKRRVHHYVQARPALGWNEF